MSKITKIHEEIAPPLSPEQERINRLWDVIVYSSEHTVRLYEMLNETITDLINIRDDRFGALTLDDIIGRFDDVLIGNDYYVNKREKEEQQTAPDMRRVE